MTEKSKKKIDQTATMTILLDKNGLDRSHNEAAQLLYQSNVQAKSRAGSAKGYEDTKYLLKNYPSDAVLQIINNEPELWQTWVKLYKAFKNSGYNKDYRPILHRINSNGHYELGNIAALTDKEHKIEHAKQVSIMVVENGNLSFKMSPTQTAAQKELNVSSTKLNSMKSHPYDLAFKDEEGNLVDTGKQLFIMPYREIAPDSKEARELKEKWESPEVKALQEQWERIFGKRERLE